jgi:hypothetical protein
MVFAISQFLLTVFRSKRNEPMILPNHWLDLHGVQKGLLIDSLRQSRVELLGVNGAMAKLILYCLPFFFGHSVSEFGGLA